MSASVSASERDAARAERRRQMANDLMKRDPSLTEAGAYGLLTQLRDLVGEEIGEIRRQIEERTLRWKAAMDEIRRRAAERDRQGLSP